MWMRPRSTSLCEFAVLDYMRTASPLPNLNLLLYMRTASPLLSRNVLLYMRTASPLLCVNLLLHEDCKSFSVWICCARLHDGCKSTSLFESALLGYMGTASPSLFESAVLHDGCKLFSRRSRDLNHARFCVYVQHQLHPEKQSTWAVGMFTRLLAANVPLWRRLSKVQHTCI